MIILILLIILGIIVACFMLGGLGAFIGVFVGARQRRKAIKAGEVEGVGSSIAAGWREGLAKQKALTEAKRAARAARRAQKKEQDK